MWVFPRQGYKFPLASSLFQEHQPLSISLAVVPITFCKLHTHSRLYKPYQSVQSADPQQTLQTLSVCSNGRPTADFTNPISLFKWQTHSRLYKPYQSVQFPHPPQTLQTLSVCSNSTPTADFTNPISLFKWHTHSRLYKPYQSVQTTAGVPTSTARIFPTESRDIPLRRPSMGRSNALLASIWRT